MNALISSTTDAIKLEQSKASGFGESPSHTQLAKDSAEHFLNPLAGKLAYIVVKEIGIQMKKVWSGDPELTIDILIENIEVGLFNHPVNISWIDDPIKEWAENNPEAIKMASSKTTASHHGELLKEKQKLTTDEINKLIKDLLDY